MWFFFSFKEIEAASPERVFKVVFVGDSGVGKSSFIHQFCSKTFKATFSATIGQYTVNSVTNAGSPIDTGL